MGFLRMERMWTVQIVIDMITRERGMIKGGNENSRENEEGVRRICETQIIGHDS